MVADHATPDRSFFLSAVFVLVGLHGLHVTIGSIWMAVMPLQLAALKIDRRVKVNLIPPQPVLAFPRRGLERDLLRGLPSRADPLTSQRIERRETMTYVVGYAWPCC